MPATNLRELIAYAKANPGKLSYGTPGIGTGNHLVGEAFKQQAGGLDMVHVPYRGIAQASNDLARWPDPAHHRRDVRCNCSSGRGRQGPDDRGHQRKAAERRAAISRPAVESGLPGLRYEGWFGIFAPKQTDDAIIDRIAQATRSRCPIQALQANYRAQGIEPDSDSTPTKFQRIVDATSASLALVIKSIGLENLEAAQAALRVTMRADSVTRPISAASIQNAIGNPPSRATKPIPAGPIRMPA